MAETSFLVSTVTTGSICTLGRFNPTPSPETEGPSRSLQSEIEAGTEDRAEGRVGLDLSVQPRSRDGGTVGREESAAGCAECAEGC